MAKTEKKQTTEPEEIARKMPLAVVTPPSLMTAAQQKEPSPFLTEMQGQAPRTEPRGIALATIDHRQGCWRLNGQEIEALEGFPIYYFQARAWWKMGYKEGDSNPPDCWSPDANPTDHKPMPDPTAPMKQAKNCDDCAFSKFGSALGGTAPGQACKTQTFLFLVNPAFGSPPVACLILPPSSIRPLLGSKRSPGYLSGAAYFKDPSSGRTAKVYEVVWTRWNLLPGGERHCIVDPKSLAVPVADEQRQLAKLRGQLMAAFEAFRGKVSAVATAEDEKN